MRRSRFHPILLAAPLALSLVSPLFADQVVYFINGKAIMVKSVEKGDKFTVLEMDGGGKMGVPTDQIARIEEYVLSAPAAPQFVAPPAPAVVQAPAVAPAPVATAPAANPFETHIGGIPANLPPAAPMVPGPGVGGRPTDGPGRGLAGLRPLELSGAAPQPSGLQRQAGPQQNAGPAMGGPAGAYRGSTAARPNFNPAGRRGGRGAMGGRGRAPEVNRYTPPAAQPPAQNQPAQNQPPAQGQAPATPNPPPPAEENPPAATEPEVESPPPTDPENEKTEPETPPPAEGETPEDSTGGAS
jgi:hypothetical protein